MSIPFNILNEEYRDMTADSLYPFSDSASLTNGLIVVRKSIFLDMTVYAVGDYEAPYHISAMDGSKGDGAVVEISDVNSSFVCSFLLDGSKDAVFCSQGERHAGVVVVDPDEALGLIGLVGESRYVFGPSQLELSASACRALKSDDLLAVSSGNDSWSDDVSILAEHGVVFEKKTESWGDEVLVHLYGEDPATDGGLLTINHVEFPTGHVWLAAHTDSDIRVVTDRDGLVIASKKDFDYGD